MKADGGGGPELREGWSGFRALRKLNLGPCCREISALGQVHDYMDKGLLLNLLRPKAIFRNITCLGKYIRCITHKNVASVCGDSPYAISE